MPTRSVRNDLHSPRNLIVPTLRVGMHPVTLCVTLQKRNAERPWRHSHAERRNDLHSPRDPIVPTLCVGMHPVTLCVTLQKRNAERPWRHSHAEREERSPQPPQSDRSHALRGNASRDALRHPPPRSGTRSVPGGIPTRSVRNDLHSPRNLIVPTLCVGMHPVTLCVTPPPQKRNAERPLAAFPRGA